MQTLRGQAVPSLTELSAVPIGADINHVVGQVPTDIIKPDGKQFLILISEVGNFRFRLGDQGRRSFANDTAVDPVTDLITVPGHGFDVGEGPFQLSTAGTLPTGLSASTDYWVIPVGDDNIQLATSKAKALADPAVAVDITADGSGTTTMDGLQDVADPVTESVNDGSGSFQIAAGADLVIPAPDKITARGFAADSVLTYYFV